MIEENIALSEKYAKKAIEIDENNFQIFCIPLNRNISDIENSIFELKSILMN
jgi:hypothetical protein